MIKVQIILLSTILSLFGCDSDFIGGGSGKFKTGDGEGGRTKPGETEGPGKAKDPEGYLDPENPLFENPKKPTIIDEDGNILDDDSIEIVGSDGSGEMQFTSATLTVKRADGAGSNAYNHRDVEIELRAGDKTTSGRVAVGSKDTVVQLPNVCTTGGKVSLRLTIHHQGLTIKPNKSTTQGGIIGYRLGEDSIYIGYEKEAIGSTSKVAWHENDDWIAQITCNPNDSGKVANITMKNTCFDQRIPGGGSNFIGKGDDGGGPKNRVCSK
jgi:hypothetical protein